MGGVDYAALLAAVPTPSLVITPGGTIVEANPAYERVSGRPRTELLGRTVTDVFPHDPGDREAGGRGGLTASLRRVLATGRTDTMARRRYDVRDPLTGAVAERYGSPVNVAVHDESGRTVAILHQVGEVNDLVDGRAADAPPGAESPETAALRRRSAREQILFRLLTASTQSLSTGAKLIALAGAAVPALCDVCAVYVLDHPVRAGRPVVGPLRAWRLAAPTSAGVIGPEPGRTSVWGDGDPATRAIGAGATVLVDYTPDAPPAWAVAAGVDGAIRDGRVHSTALVPVVVDGLAHAFIAFGAGPERPAYDDEQRELFELVARQTAEAMRQGDRYDHVRDTSLILQRAMLTDPPELPDLDIVVRYRPAGEGTEVGGDWHDVFHLADPTDGIAVVVGDVAGHDVTAATVMGQVRSMLRGFTVHNGGRPDETLTALNHVIRHTGLTHLATCVVMHVHPAPDPAAGLDLTWSNAGHPAPILLDPSGVTAALAEPHDPALGATATAARTSDTRRLPRGSTLLLFSDGLFERRRIDYDESFERLRRMVGTLTGLSTAALCDALLEAAPHDDDVVIVALRSR